MRVWGRGGAPAPMGATAMLLQTVHRHLYTVKKDPQPQCEHCQCILTVRHILVECNHLAQTRKDISARREVMESFRSYPTFVPLFFKRLTI